MVFVNKLYSTLKKNNQCSQFLSLLSAQVQATLASGSFLIFSDINHRDMGRDQFNTAVSRLFRLKNCYYFPVDNAYSGNFTAIGQTRNVFSIPAGIAVSPKPDVTKAVIFEYQK